MSKLVLDNNENFDGIVEKLIINNDERKTTIIIKQWNNEKTYSLSALEFENVIFQSLPDIGSFNLIREIDKREQLESVLTEFSNYVKDNPTLILSDTEKNISNNISNLNSVQSYLFESGYCKDWFIVCEGMTLKEIKNVKNR